ncbi:MAG: patatin-like phospholipase family protein [Oscillospiraceae bacterium]
MTNRQKSKTALVLSGGGSRGAYEAGVWQALVDLGIKIDIVTGSSVGAINGAKVCQGDLDDTINLWREIQTHMVFDVPEDSQLIDYAKLIFSNGGAGISGLKALLEKYIDEERIRKSPVDYGLVVMERASMKPHYLYKEDIPKGKLIDYILASSSVFPAVHPYEIDGVEYIDGGYADVLPVDLAMKKNPSSIIAVKLNAMGILKKEPLKKAKDITVIESSWNLGSTLIFDTNNSRRNMRLGYLDTLKTFGILTAVILLLPRETFQDGYKMGGSRAKIFRMDPCLIYSKESFLRMLPEAVANAQQEVDEAWEAFKSIRRIHVRIPDYIQDIKSAAGPRAICRVIAENIKEKGLDSIFMSNAVIALIPEQVIAARFLVKYGIV